MVDADTTSDADTGGTPDADAGGTPDADAGGDNLGPCEGLTLSSEAGEILYQENKCAGCHLNNGGPGNVAMMVEFSKTAVMQDTAYIYDKIYNGVGFMSAYGEDTETGSLTTQEVCDVTAYVQTFAPD